MRVLLVSGSLPPMKCGVGDYAAHLASAIAAQPHMTVAVLTDVAAESAAPRPFEVMPVVRGWRLADGGRILRIARQWRPDVLHVQYPTQGYGRRLLPWLIPSMAAACGIGVVQTWHEYFRQDGYRPLKASLLNVPNALLPGGLVVLRPRYTEMMAGWYRILVRHKRLRLIPTGSTIPAANLQNGERTELRTRFAAGTDPLVVFFGFAYPAKGVEQLFRIADPSRDRLALIAELREADSYHRAILQRALSPPWAGRVTITGFLPGEEVARILAAADAVVLPFREGCSGSNTSLRAAMTQGVFVLTTSRERAGYDSETNVYYARPDDIEEMSRTLRMFAGRRRDPPPESVRAEWDAIAKAHVALYESVARRPRGMVR